MPVVATVYLRSPIFCRSFATPWRYAAIQKQEIDFSHKLLSPIAKFIISGTKPKTVRTASEPGSFASDGLPLAALK